MSLRPLHLILAATLLIFATDASLHTAAAKTTHSKHHHSKVSKADAEPAPPEHVGHSCSGTPALTVRGDIVTSRGLVDAMADAYQAANHACVEVQPFNTLSGIDAALNGSVDIAASARAGAPDRMQEAGLTFTPVAWDALVMITSPDNPVSGITLKQLHDVYYGLITNWQQLGGKDEPIDLYTVASPLDGAEYSLRNLMFGSGTAPVMQPRMYINVNMLEQGVALDPRALGLSTLSGVHDNKDVKVIPIEGVMPTLETISNGSYPLYTPIYLAASPTSAHAAQIAQFMQFLSSDPARQVMRTHDLLPYADAPALTAQSTDQQIASIMTRMESEGLAPPHRMAVSAPGATYSHDASVAPGSQATAQAQLQLAQSHATVPTAAPMAIPQPAGSSTQSAAALAQSTAMPMQTTGNPAQTSSSMATTQTGGMMTNTATMPTSGALAAAVPGAAISKSAKTSSDPSVRQAQAVAPSNPVVISTNGAVTPVQTPTATATPSSYTVVKGDTLSSIARKQSVSVTDLRKWNHLKSNTLRVGQVLQLASAN